MGGHAMTYSCGCCGCGCGTLTRRFITPAEEKEMLEKYRDSLKNELTGLEEHLKELNARLSRIA
jgi:hypothetical protein